MSEIAQFAQKYRLLGWNVIPLYNYSKNPAPLRWKDYQERMATDKEFDQWFSDPNITGLGLITGKLSGIVVLDEDIYKEGGKRVTVQTGMMSQTARGGKHHFFRYVEPIKSSGFREGINVEIKADGGFVVLPPSRVIANKDSEEVGSYEWVEKCMPGDLMEMREDMLAPYRGDGDKQEFVDIRKVINAKLGTQHNNLRTLTLATLNKFPEAQWDIAAEFVRFEASKFDPPHPIDRVEKMLRDCAQFIRQHPKEVDKEIASEMELPVQVGDLVDERLADRELEKIAPKTCWPELDKLIKGFVPAHTITFTGDTNVGKCMGKDTQLLMFDGSIKAIQNVTVGDLLMGPDNMPRKVLSTTQGEDEMFLINQQWGMSYSVNKDHLLSLRCSTIARKEKYYKEYSAGKIINIPVSEYLNKSGNFKKFTRGWHVPVDFVERQLSIPPYLLGVWLGDGNTRDCRITSADTEIMEFLQNFAVESGLSYIARTQKNNNSLMISITSRKKGGSHRGDSFQRSLRQIGVIGHKHIPEVYRISSREQRLQLLAGLIDTDGWVQKNISVGTGKECFSYAISITNKELADDIFLLTASLGFNTKVNRKIARMKRDDGSVYETLCYTVSIQGDLTSIPVKIPRKKITSVRSKSVGFSSIKVEPLGRGNYYGFTLDGDGLYLLADCTVTHNTTIACNFAEALRNQGKYTLYIALEPDVMIVEYLASIRFQTPFEQVTIEQLQKLKDDQYIHVYRQRTIRTVQDLLRAVRQMSRHYDLIIIDHIGYFVQGEKNWIQEQSNVIKELAILSKEKKTCTMMIAHLRKPTQQGKKNQEWIPSQNDIAGSAAFKQDSTDVLIATRSIKENGFGVEFTDMGNLIVSKSKVGKNGGLRLLFSDGGAKVWSMEEANNSTAGRMFLELRELKQFATNIEATAPWMGAEKEVDTGADI